MSKDKDASESEVRTSPRKDKTSKSEMYTAREVAKILGVDEKSIRKWRSEYLFGCCILPEDLLDHNGVYYYYKKRIDELATVFRKDWRTAWAKPTKDLNDILQEKGNAGVAAEMKKMLGRKRKSGS